MDTKYCNPAVAAMIQSDLKRLGVSAAEYMQMLMKTVIPQVEAAKGEAEIMGRQEGTNPYHHYINGILVDMTPPSDMQFETAMEELRMCYVGSTEEIDELIRKGQARGSIW